MSNGSPTSDDFHTARKTRHVGFKMATTTIKRGIKSDKPVDANFLSGCVLALTAVVKNLLHQQSSEQQKRIIASLQQWEERTKSPRNSAEDSLQRGINSVCQVIEKI